MLPSKTPLTARPGRADYGLSALTLTVALLSSACLADSRSEQAGTKPPFAVQADLTPASALPDAWLETINARALPGMDLRARPAIVDAWGLDLGDGALLRAQAFNPASARDPGTGLLAIPSLEGGVAHQMGADGDLVLRFDHPVGNLTVKSPLLFAITAEASRRTFRLKASRYGQGQTYPLQLNWQAVTGETLPPLNLEVTTPPALTVTVNTQGITNLGLVLPLQLNFSEPLRERMRAKQGVSIKTIDGSEVPGSWLWIGKQRLQFKPKPAWPASTTFEVRGDETLLRAERGGRLEAPIISQFSTGTDRRIYVYLDKQQATAVENGQVVRTFKVSTGKAKTPTSAGDFYIYDRYLRKTMRSRGIPKGRPGYYEVEDVPYTQFFKGDLALHGAFWHNGFGRPASHGCVNLATREKNKRWPTAPEDAGWLYSWAALGVPVTVYKEAPVEIAVK